MCCVCQQIFGCNDASKVIINIEEMFISWLKCQYPLDVSWPVHKGSWAAANVFPKTLQGISRNFIVSSLTQHSITTQLNWPINVSELDFMVFYRIHTFQKSFMPILPKLPTCFEKVTYIWLTVHYSCYRQGREKTAKITMEVWCEQNRTSIADLIGCN